MSKEDLIPFKKGQSGNPAGRPKGSKNRSTIIKEILNLMVQVKDESTGEDVWQSNEYRMVQAMVNKAIEKGDVAPTLLLMCLNIPFNVMYSSSVKHSGLE
jgi:hypothetical protein